MTTDLSSLIERMGAARSHRRLRFSLCSERGWVVTDDEPTIRLLCDMLNSRHQIASALKARSPSHEG